MNQPISLMDFVKGFLIYAYEERQKKNFPGFPDWRWHEFLYSVQQKIGSDNPGFMFHTRFSWNSAHPRSEDVDEVLLALSVHIFYPDGEGRWQIEPEIKKFQDRWYRFESREYAEMCYTIASSVEGFFKKDE